jgi:ParB/RepB/Spo0J family partition protein
MATHAHTNQTQLPGFAGGFIVSCADDGGRSCYIQLDNTHIPAASCTCERRDRGGPENCPVDLHQARRRQHEMQGEESAIMAQSNAAVAPTLDRHPVGGIEIALDRIEPSPLNPRKHIDPAALKDLTASIAASGVHQPIVVRPKDLRAWAARGDDWVNKLKFELVVGERRWRASQQAGLKTIPAIVRPLSNAETLEAQIVENLQREDVTALEEAAAYQMLLQKSDSTKVKVDDIATRVGKSKEYVWGRLKLLSLAPISRQALELGRITPSHAVLIARLRPIDQARALVATLNAQSYDSKPKDPVEEATEALREAVEDLNGVDSRLSEKSLREWIAENVDHDLKKATWDLKVFVAQGAPVPCEQCPMKEGMACHDPGCFKIKRQAMVQSSVKAVKQETGEKPMLLSMRQAYTPPSENAAVLQANQWVPAKAGSCDHVEKAVVKDGDQAGKIRLVCTDVSCKVHKRESYVLRRRETRNAYDPEKERIRREKEQKARERNDEIRRRAAIAVATRSGDLGKLELAALVMSLASTRDFDEGAIRRRHPEIKNSNAWNWLERHLEPRVLKMTPSALKKWLLELLVFHVATAHGMDDLFAKFCAAHKVDEKKIAQAYDQEQKEKTKAAQTSAPPAKPKAKAKGAGR